MIYCSRCRITRIPRWYIKRLEWIERGKPNRLFINLASGETIQTNLKRLFEKGSEINIERNLKYFHETEMISQWNQSSWNHDGEDLWERLKFSWDTKEKINIERICIFFFQFYFLNVGIADCKFNASCFFLM